MAERRDQTYFALAQQKGGCGKTVSACWMAWLLSLQHRVAVVDLDPQGAATTLLGMSERYQHGAYDLIVGGEIPKDAIARSRIPNSMLVPATDALIMAEMDARIQTLDFDGVRARFSKIFQSFDYIIFDCGAGLGILTSLAMSIADKVIIPKAPGELDERAAHATLRHLTRLRRDGADSGMVLSVMEQGEFRSKSGPLPFTATSIPMDEGPVEKFRDMAGSTSPDTSDALVSAYFALIHEL